MRIASAPVDCKQVVRTTKQHDHVITSTVLMVSTCCLALPGTAPAALLASRCCAGCAGVCPDITDFDAACTALSQCQVENAQLRGNHTRNRHGST